MSDSTLHDRLMHLALCQAEHALHNHEFPVGCVIALDGTVIAEGHRINSHGIQRNEMDHAEIVALRSLGNMNSLPNSSKLCIYTTMEPCLMCYSTLLVNGITNIVYAYEDAMGGGTSLPLESLNPLYRDLNVSITSGIKRKESLKLFYRYFNDSQHDYLRDTSLCKTVFNDYNTILPSV